MSTCDRLDLQTLGSQPDMPKNLADHCNFDNLWVSQSSTTPTILHNDECCPPSYGTVGFCVPGGQIRGRHMAVRCQPTYIVGILYWKNESATFYLTCDHFRDVTQPILALNLVFIGKRPMKSLQMMLLSTYTNGTIEKSPPPYNTTLGSRQSFIPKPISTPSSTLIPTIKYSLTLTHNY